MSVSPDGPFLFIDAFSQIFRCFFAIVHLSDSRGEPTNAILGMSKLLLEIHKNHPGSRGAFVFDCGRVHFRQELIAEYKANRPPMPQELAAQLNPIREIVKAFGWPILEEPEYEADDLIAALVRHVPGTAQFISSDKDLTQLIDERVQMLLPAKPSGFEQRDAAAVQAKFGVKPTQIVDYLSLLGDASDNIPGVTGIGPKTAVKLLQDFDSLDEFYAAPERCTNEKLREKLLANREIVARNRKLIALRTDLPARLNPAENSCRRTEPDWAKLREIFTHYELKNLLRELEKFAPSPAKPNGGEQGQLFDF